MTRQHLSVMFTYLVRTYTAVPHVRRRTGCTLAAARGGSANSDDGRGGFFGAPIEDSGARLGGAGGLAEAEFGRRRRASDPLGRRDGGRGRPPGGGESHNVGGRRRAGHGLLRRREDGRWLLSAAALGLGFTREGGNCGGIVLVTAAPKPPPLLISRAFGRIELIKVRK
ncbi:hypothetical protein GUJ93_ZPchr1061g2835 [Zizania palustris]|uniref:Uncharacterized protein n=1 Tax=Zizania palustris TaxID=103762 RepID=A0A8J5V8J1_ZIZPA|nr:hypothetical protein GUJ93_ZPchr1061g2835 [Zizania palustris]